MLAGGARWLSTCCLSNSLHEPQYIVVSPSANERTLDVVDDDTQLKQLSTSPAEEDVTSTSAVDKSPIESLEPSEAGQSVKSAKTARPTEAATLIEAVRLTERLTEAVRLTEAEPGLTEAEPSLPEAEPGLTEAESAGSPREPVLTKAEPTEAESAGPPKSSRVAELAVAGPAGPTVSTGQPKSPRATEPIEAQHIGPPAETKPTNRLTAQPEPKSVESVGGARLTTTNSSSSVSHVETINGGAEIEIGPNLTPWSADAEQIAQQVKADTEARAMVQLQRSLVHLSALQKEIEELLTDEQLFKAQFAADALQRLVKQHAATANALEAPEAKALANRFIQIGQDFAKTSSCQSLEIRLQALQRVLKLFSLESRFDTTIFEAEPDMSFQHRSRGFSTSSIDWVAISSNKDTVLPPLSETAAIAAPDVTPVSNNNPNEAKPTPMLSFRSATRNLFRLASRAGPPRRSRLRIRKRRQKSGVNMDSRWDGAHECKGMAWKHTVLPDGSIAVSLRAKLRVPLFKILAILNETDYYPRWVPYCKDCRNLGQISRASMVLQQVSEYPWPIKMKETICYTQGVDALDEFGCVILCAANLTPTESSNPEGYLGVTIPPVQKKVPRIPSGDILFLLSPVEGNACTIVELFANVDTGINSTTLRNVLIPVLKTVVIKTVRGFLYKIGVLATNFENNGYAEKVKQNQAIYDWISSRINEGVATGIFPPSSSMATLNFEELKG